VPVTRLARTPPPPPPPPRQQNEEDAYRKMRLRVEDVQGRNVLTNFWVRLQS
jgi:hypothetical protein